MKNRFSNLLVSAVLALWVFVWVPTLAVGWLKVEPLESWTETLNTARIGCKGVVNTYCPNGPVGRFYEDGLAIWGLITGLFMALLYFVTGSLRLTFYKDEKANPEN